jgi:hypothetical protein
MAYEPGLDLHEWVSEWQQLEPLVRDSPEEALPEVHDLVERMLTERGFLGEDRAAVDGADPEIIAEWNTVADIVRRVESAEVVDPSDVGQAVSGLRSLYEYLTVERSTP